MITVHVWIYIRARHLTHWGRDKMAAISQTMFSNAFSWMKMYEFRLKFHWSLFLRFQLTIFQHWFRYWLGAVRATSLNQWWLVYWRIYASLGLNELTHLSLVPHIYASVNWVSICSGNGLSPARRQAITWINAGLLSFEPLGINFSEI